MVGVHLRLSELTKVSSLAVKSKQKCSLLKSSLAEECNHLDMKRTLVAFERSTFITKALDCPGYSVLCFNNANLPKFLNDLEAPCIASLPDASDCR